MLRRSFNFLKRRFPGLFQRAFSLRDAILVIPLRLQLSRIRKGEAHLSAAYLSRRFPKAPALRSEFSHGGAVKLTYLSERFPHHFPSANLLYAVSSVGHPIQLEILAKAKHKGLKIVFNQNGVAFPAWAGKNYVASNALMKKMIGLADFIIYQSQFCKISAERYISPPNVQNEIIYNPVDTRLFSPDACPTKPEVLTLLLGGNQYEKYRLELALQTLKALHRDMPDAKLIITGDLWLPRPEAEAWTRRALQDLNLIDHVTFTGTYTQTDAPALYSQAQILLHTKYADPSPGLVVEALALGMPVVHLDNGGVPELVHDAGLGVRVQHDWDRINLPNPQDMADAVLQVHSNFDDFSHQARQRAVEKFSLENFIAKHQAVFEKVLESSA